MWSAVAVQFVEIDTPVASAVVFYDQEAFLPTVVTLGQLSPLVMEALCHKGP